MTNRASAGDFAAIIAMDVVGYSRLMGEDESGTLAALKSIRTVLIEPKAAQYGVRTIKLLGDGALMECGSAVDAVRFAVEVQSALRRRSADRTPGQQIDYRMGINIGDVIVEGDDIFGDGVNIAARLEGLAAPGGISISRPVHTQVKAKLDLTFEAQGPTALKNIVEAVDVYRVVLDDKAEAFVTPLLASTRRPSRRIAILATAVALSLTIVSSIWWWQPWAPGVDGGPAREAKLPLPAKPSVAVLPFVNLSGGPELDRFSDGMAEDIITALSQLPNLFVIARTSSFSYKGKSLSARAIAESLGVRYVLEGSVREAGDRYRITAHLVDARADRQVWAEQYDKSINEVLDVQADVAQRVADALEVSLTEGQQATLRRKSTDNPEAYRLYRLAEDSLRRLTKSDLDHAVELAKQALALDPNFAVAWGVLGWAKMQYGRFFGSGWSDAAAEASALAQRALAIDDHHAPAVILLGYARLSERRFEEAVELGERAANLWPGSADIVALYGTLLLYAGRYDAGAAQLSEAMRLSPVFPDWYLGVRGNCLLWAGSYKAAKVEYDRLLDRRPTGVSLGFALAGRAEAHFRLGDDDSARHDIAMLRGKLPWYTIGFLRRTQYFKDQAAYDERLALLHQIGLPD